ncbi:hypothetical protein WDU94_009831 [Cyamophila willieti]
MRDLAKLLMSANKTHPKITRLDQLLTPKNYDVILQEVKKMCGFDEKTNQYAVPSQAIKLGQHLKSSLNLLIINATKQEDNEYISLLKGVEDLLEKDWPHQISRHARKTLKERKWNKQFILPKTSDIHNVMIYLKDNEKSLLEELQEDLSENTTKQSWIRLASLLLVHTIIFNRRRSGEVARMPLVNFTNRNKTAMDEDLAEHFLSPMELKLKDTLEIVQTTHMMMMRDGDDEEEEKEKDEEDDDDERDEENEEEEDKEDENGLEQHEQRGTTKTKRDDKNEKERRKPKILKRSETKGRNDEGKEEQHEFEVNNVHEDEQDKNGVEQRRRKGTTKTIRYDKNEKERRRLRKNPKRSETKEKNDEDKEERPTRRGTTVNKGNDSNEEEEEWDDEDDTDKDETYSPTGKKKWGFSTHSHSSTESRFNSYDEKILVDKKRHTNYIYRANKKSCKTWKKWQDDDTEVLKNSFRTNMILGQIPGINAIKENLKNHAGLLNTRTPEEIRQKIRRLILERKKN